MESVNSIFTIKILRTVFKYHRSKEFRLINKLFWEVYDEFDTDLEEFKDQDATKDAQMELYQQIKQFWSGRFETVRA